MIKPTVTYKIRVSRPNHENFSSEMQNVFVWLSTMRRNYMTCLSGLLAEQVAPPAMVIAAVLSTFMKCEKEPIFEHQKGCVKNISSFSGPYPLIKSDSPCTIHSSREGTVQGFLFLSHPIGSYIALIFAIRITYPSQIGIILDLDRISSGNSGIGGLPL